MKIITLTSIIAKRVKPLTIIAFAFELRSTPLIEPHLAAPRAPPKNDLVDVPRIRAHRP